MSNHSSLKLKVEEEVESRIDVDVETVETRQLIIDGQKGYLIIEITIQCMTQVAYVITYYNSKIYSITPILTFFLMSNFHEGVEL